MSAQVAAVLEPNGLSRRDGKRPDGLTLFPWSQRKCVVWDFTCRNTLCARNVNMTSQEASKAAAKAVWLANEAMSVASGDHCLT